MIRVLFICTGNICRSSMAEGFFRQLITAQSLENKIACDSAGLIDFHEGNPPDHRAQRRMQALNIDISTQCSRPLTQSDLTDFDYLIAMDSGHYSALQGMIEPSDGGSVVQMMHCAPELNTSDVPDPYYGDESGFVEVAEMLQPATRGLLQMILDRH